MTAAAPPRLRFLPEGIEVEHGLLWLDAQKPKPLGLVTHAHGDHVARHKTILCTPETAALVRKRQGPGAEFLECRCGESVTVGDLKVTLLHAGHILGSAMALIEGAGGSVLYTGDVRPEGGLTCSPAEFRHADVLVTECTFGRPDHRLPPADETRAEIVAWVHSELESGRTATLLAYALGKGQEMLALLTRAGIPVAAHGTIWNLTDIYRQFGYSFPGSRKLTGKGQRRAAILVPPRYLNVTEVKKNAPLAVAAVTGWSGRARSNRVERVFPLSDHADYDGLIKVAQSVNPKKIYTLHGYAREFAQDLRERGYDADAIPGHSGPPDDGSRPGMW